MNVFDKVNYVYAEKDLDDTHQNLVGQVRPAVVGQISGGFVWLVVTPETGDGVKANYLANKVEVSETAEPGKCFVPVISAAPAPVVKPRRNK
jgi:hypothetical protein